MAGHETTQRQRSFRADDETWGAFLSAVGTARAHDPEVTATVVLRRLVRWYAGLGDLPVRPVDDACAQTAVAGTR